MSLKINNPFFSVVRFKDTLDDDPDLAWVEFDGIKLLVSQSLIAILKHNGYIKDEQGEAKETVIPIDFDKLY